MRLKAQLRYIAALAIGLGVVLTVVGVVSLGSEPQTASATPPMYSINFKAADPTLYTHLVPGSLPCPAGARQNNPLAGAQFGTGVESLAPADMTLGQVVPFEFQISAGGSAPSNGSIEFTATWSAVTTSGDPFGYDDSYLVYCAFVDTSESGSDSNASVSKTASVVGTDIAGVFTVTGLDPNETVVVEVWLVLDSTIAPGTQGNVQARLESIGGEQTIPLQKVQEFLVPTPTPTPTLTPTATSTNTPTATATNTATATATNTATATATNTATATATNTPTATATNTATATATSPPAPTATPTATPIEEVRGVEVVATPAELPKGGGGIPGVLLAGLALIALGSGTSALAVAWQRK